MEITMLGTGSPIPDANRAAPAALVKAGDTHILLDAGRGVVMRMTAAGSLPGMLGGVLITHFHSDHIAALNDVITTHWVMTQENATLKIFGPEGIVELVDLRKRAELDCNLLVVLGAQLHRHLKEAAAQGRPHVGFDVPGRIVGALHRLHALRLQNLRA